MSIRVGVGIVLQWPFEERDARLLFRYAERMEALGLDSLWLNDRVIGPGGMPDPLPTFAALASITTRLKFGPCVFILSTRNPLQVAKEIATIDYLSGGRMLPAFGLGQEDDREYEAAGILKAERAARVEEAVPLLRRLWSEERVTHHGRFFNLTDVTIEPRPIQARLPIWFGGHTDAAYRRVGRLGDGWLAAFVTPDQAREAVSRIREHAQQAGREIEDDHYGVLLNICIAANREEAIRLAGRELALRRRPDRPSPEEYSALGTPADCIRTIQTYIDAGVSKFVLRAVCPPEKMFEQLEIMGREVAAPIHALQKKVSA